MARTAPATTREKKSQSQTTTLEPEQAAVKAPSFESAPESNGHADAQEPVEQAIARLAYSYWLERQGTDEGSAEDDWFRAEREFRARQAARP